MFNGDEAKERETIHTPLIELCDDLNDLNSYLFFFCDAISGVLSPDFALAGMPAVTVDDGPGFRAGQAVPAGPGGEKGLVRVYGADDEFLGVGERSGDGMLAPRRVFKSSEKTP